MFEYLFNNDTQQMCNELSMLAQSDEPALRKECQEVSLCVDTSSLDAKRECVQKIDSVSAVFAKIAEILKGLSQSFSGGADIFGTRDGKKDFEIVCRAVIAIEDARGELFSCIAELTKTRQALFATVADANRALHFLKLAKQAVSLKDGVPYTRAIERAEVAYSQLTELDAAVREMQIFSMTFIEQHLPAFMERLRTVADFHHAGASLQRGAIRTLCTEAQIIINRAPNITF